MTAWKIALTIVLIAFNLYMFGTVIACVLLASAIKRDPEARRIADGILEALDVYPRPVAISLLYGFCGVAWPVALVRRLQSRGGAG